MDARIDLVPRWRGGDLDQLIDTRHAGMVETLVRRLASLPDWIVQPEVMFSIYGERGSIDVIAWHPGRRALLAICSPNESWAARAGRCLSFHARRGVEGGRLPCQSCCVGESGKHRRVQLSPDDGLAERPG